MEPRGRNAFVGGEGRRLTGGREKARPWVGPGEKRDPEGSAHEDQQRSAGAGSHDVCSDKQGSAQHESQRRDEQQPEPERFDRHGGRSVRAELEADLLP